MSTAPAPEFPEQDPLPMKPAKKRKDRSAYFGAHAEAKLADDAAKQRSFPIKKAGSLDFFTACPDEDAFIPEAAVIDAGMDGIFLINHRLLDNAEVRRRVRMVALQVCQNHKGKYFVYPVALGNIKSATATLKILQDARRCWIRTTWNAFSQSYDVETMSPELYPDIAVRAVIWEPSGDEILSDCVDDNSIDDLGDPRLKKLIGGLL